MADAKRGKMHASASQLALVLLLIGCKGGANLLSQSHRVESAKPITFRHSNENRSRGVQFGKDGDIERLSTFSRDRICLSAIDSVILLVFIKTTQAFLKPKK